MFKITQLTDYSLLILSLMSESPFRLYSASKLAEMTHLNLPTVARLLKNLSKQNFLQAHRGVKGGYSLKQKTEQLSLAKVLEALEGPIALTRCQLGDKFCTLAPSCQTKSPWQKINQQIVGLLNQTKLSDLSPSHYKRSML